MRIHTLLDGRDVGETSALEYVLPFEEFLTSLNGDGFDAGLRRLALHAGELVIKRPSDGMEMTLKAPVPEIFKGLFDNES